jgi:uncharacterized ferredoxin-like protein
MSIISVDPITLEKELISIARKMIIAATTAPKARGLNCLDYAIITGDEITRLSIEMDKIGQTTGQAFFVRDAKSILNAPVILLLGAKIQPLNLKDCRYCGYPDCGHKSDHPTVPCAHNITDLGIAIGSAVSTASNFHIDNRVMFSAGKASLSLNYLSSDVAIAYAIPLSVSSKSIFFDRG